MNKLYVTALAVAMSSYGASAQNGTQIRAMKQSLVAEVGQQPHPAPVVSENRAIIWSDDFSNPATWTFGTLGGAAGSWTIGTTAPGGPPYNIAPIASTTASNNFALYDSNVLNLNGDNAWMATATPIDLSASPGVVLQFEQFYRALNGDCYVETSVDGTLWTSILINSNVAANTSTPNPDLRSVNLSSQIGGAPAAWIRFRYESPTADYAWMIDDVALISLPDNELVMDYGYTSQTGSGYEYGRTPVNQLLPTLNVGAEVVNFGGMDETNVVVNVSLRDANNVEVGSATSQLGTMMTGDTIVTDENIVLPNPVSTGLYTAYFTMTSDQIGMDDDTTNNSKIREFEVTTDLYSLDGIDVYPNNELILTQNGTASFADNATGLSMLNYYQVNAQSTFYGAQILLGSQSAAGSLISVALYDTAGVAPSVPLPNQLYQSEDHVVTAAEIAAGQVDLRFLDDAVLPAGGYFLAATISQQDGNDLYILDDVTVPQPFDASYLYLPVDVQNRYLYSNGNAWAIRLSADPSVGVKEVAGLKGVNMYPNPTTGVLHINTAKAETTTVEVRNMLGAVVKNTTLNGTVNTIDLAGNAPGLYTVRIGNGTNYAVQLVTLQ